MKFLHVHMNLPSNTLQASHNSAILSQIVWQGLKLQLQQMPTHQRTAVLEQTMDNPMQIVVVLVLFHSVQVNDNAKDLLCRVHQLYNNQLVQSTWYFTFLTCC